MNDSESFELDVAAEAPACSTTLEFAVTAAGLSGFGRATTQQTAHLVWYDDADGTLTADRLCLCHDGIAWQLARLTPDAGFDWPACHPPSPLGAASDPSDLPVPADLVPVSAFDGFRRRTRAGDVELDWLHGTVHGIVAGRPAGRLTLTGPGSAIVAWLATRAPLELSVPRASLAQEALAAASATPVPARHLGAPGLPANGLLSDGLATLLGHLLDALLCSTDAIGVDDRPEAIHQARVATRRLRSALSIYRAIAPSLGSIAEEIRICAARLGSVRDWDVFLTGTGAQLVAASGNDPRIGSLLRACRRKRDQAATALSDYLASPEFRRLELAIGIAAALRPWETEAAGIGEVTTPFAAAVLTRRFRRARRRARAIDTLPIEDLHELRKDCKRLRYAAEFFAPSFPGRPTRMFLRRLGDLQEQLGLLNDAAGSAQLMAQLGRVGRGYAGGMADGLAAAACLPARQRVSKSWRRFRRAGPFWK